MGARQQNAPAALRGNSQNDNDSQSQNSILGACVNYDGLRLTAGDAVQAHWYDKGESTAPTPLERFALGPSALLTAQAWTIPDHPYLPSTAWWRRLGRCSDRALARVTRRVAGLVRGDPALLDLQWRESWRALLLPKLMAEIDRRRERARRPLRTFNTPPPDVLDMMQKLTGEPGQKRGREWWFRCPFHTEKTPSLAVNVEKQVWHCHGCGRGGGWSHLMREVAA